MPNQYADLLKQVQSANRWTYEDLLNRGSAAVRAHYPSSDLPMDGYRPHLLRAGLTNILVEFGALVDLLLEKGILTREEVTARFELLYVREVLVLKKELALRLGVDPAALDFA